MTARAGEAETSRSPLPANPPDGSAASDPPTVDVGLRWIGHSTVLVQLPGLALLTDPLFRDRLGPLRRHGPAPDPASLPAPDIVLVSHAHPDHFDLGSLRGVPGDPLFVVPRGMGSTVRRSRPRARVEEVRLGDVMTMGRWAIRAVRARHWRWPVTPAARALGYLVEGPVGVWFAGDTDEFAEMRELAGRVDVALLPIGQWGPHVTPGHLTPESAARVAAMVRARVVLPIHWGTLYPRGLDRLAPGPLREPAERFRRALDRRAPAVECRPLLPGEATGLRFSARSGPGPGP